MNAPVLDQTTVLELTVNNHPGVMSHVCGLFSRRSFNLDGILCAPVAGKMGNGGGKSRMWLLVDDDERLEQVHRQLDKLHDVLEVRRGQVSPEDWTLLQRFFSAS